MSSSLALLMRDSIASGRPEAAVEQWNFTYDTGCSPYRMPTDRDELFQLVSALTSFGSIGRALRVTEWYPELLEGEMGADVQRVIGLGELLRGNVETASARLAAATSSRGGDDDPKLVLDKVALARVSLVQGESSTALGLIEQTLQTTASLDDDDPVNRHTNYWYLLMRIFTTGHVDFERASIVSQTDKAMHRRKIAAQLARTHDPRGAAWKALRREHARPTRGTFIIRPVTDLEDPFGWFYRYR